MMQRISGLTRIASGFAWCGLAACAAPAANSEQAALLINPAPQCHAQIEQVLSERLKAPVTISRQVFEKDATLLLERPDPRDASGRRLDGRMLGRPESFRLVTDGKRCIITSDQEKEHAVLPACNCRAL